MPFQPVINASQSLSTQDKIALRRELDLLRSELDDIRTKYTALRALLVAGTAVGAGYGTGTALATSVFTAT